MVNFSMKLKSQKNFESVLHVLGAGGLKSVDQSLSRLARLCGIHKRNSTPGYTRSQLVENISIHLFALALSADSSAHIENW